MENVVIIGSGCAGWTAAIYTARANLNPLLITGQQPGGLLTTTSTVENFPGFRNGIEGTALMTEMQEQATRFGTRIQYLSKVDSVDLSGSPLKLTVEGKVIETKSIIVAVGAGHRHLGAPGEHELENKGVTYCATCDGALPIFRNKPLVVIGGGDSACEEASYLTHFASQVYLIHRRDSLRASKIMADRTLANPKITMVWNSVVEEVLDVAQDQVTGVRRPQHADLPGEARHDRRGLSRPWRREPHECPRRLRRGRLRGLRLPPGNHRGRDGVRRRDRRRTLPRRSEMIH